MNIDFGAKWRMDNVESAHFHVNKDIDRLINDTESIVTQDIEGGDRQKAMKRLRVPPLNEQQSPWITFKVGIFSGAFIVLMVTVILTGIFHTNKDWEIGIRLFRGPLLIIGFLFLWGLNVYGWRSAGNILHCYFYGWYAKWRMLISRIILLKSSKFFDNFVCTKLEHVPSRLCIFFFWTLQCSCNVLKSDSASNINLLLVFWISFVDLVLYCRTDEMAVFRLLNFNVSMNKYNR